jgi:hypothetical protein
LIAPNFNHFLLVKEKKHAIQMWGVKKVAWLNASILIGAFGDQRAFARFYGEPESAEFECV